MDLEEICKRTLKDMEKIIKVNLASGRDYKEGYFNVDNLSMNPNSKVDMVADITKVNFPENSLEEVRLIHFLMYVTPIEALELLHKWRGWLKNGGNLVIETSDAKKIAKLILEDGVNIRQMFGYGDTAGHRWSYTTESLTALLKEVGFNNISTGNITKKPERDFTLIATK